MRFNKLKIYELVTPNKHELTHEIDDVSVSYANGTGKALHGDAMENINNACIIETFDDDPVTIGLFSLRIDGILKNPEPITPNGYGYWELDLMSPVSSE